MRYIDFLRWGSLSALFLALFVPFIVAVGGVWPNMFFPYITGKNFAFRILVEIALWCYVLLALREPKYRPRASTLMWVVLAFVGWMAVATFFSVDPIKSFWSNFERMEGYIGLLHLFAWFMVAGALLSANKLWDAFLNTSVGLSALQGVMALFQALHWFGFAPSSQSGARADTTFGNATYLAVYLLINFFLTLYLLARTKSFGQRITYGALLVLQVCGILLTETRGALLGLGLGLVLAALYYLVIARGAESRVARRIAIGALVSVVIAAGAIFAVRDTAFVREIPALRRLASISLTETTVVSRLQYIWPMAFKGALERPLIGWGQENFNFVFNKNYDPGMYNQEQWFDRAHNQFLDWLVAGGVPAFLLYTTLYVLAFLIVLRAPHLSAGERAALVGLLGAYAFNNLFVFDNLVSGVYFFLLLAYLHSLSSKVTPSLAWSRPLGDHAIAIAAPIVLVVGLGGMWALNASGFARASTLVSAIQTQEAGLNASGAVVGVPKDPKKNIAEFLEILGPVRTPDSPLGLQEASEQFLQFAASLGSATGVDPQTKFDLFTSANTAMERMLASRPGDARLELFAATFLGSYGQIPSALEHLDKALELSPRKQQIQIQRGLTLLQSGDTQGALSALKAAHEAAPGYTTARLFYAAALYYAGNGAVADALLEEGFGAKVIDDPQLLQVFMNLKLYDRAIEIWKLRVEKAPNDVQLRLGLASVYFAACKNTEVVTELQTIARLQPAAALEMQNLIKQIQDGSLKCGA
jgi:O-antigen ligase/tetratricopeptide (TPR) repeat protein